MNCSPSTLLPAERLGFLPSRPRSRSSSTGVFGSNFGNTTAQRFREHCEDEFEYLARENPADLVRLMNEELASKPALLTFAAEALGSVRDSRFVMQTLIPLLNHQEPVVREGAVIGLMGHTASSIEVRTALRQRAARDESPGVKAAIVDALFHAK